MSDVQRGLFQALYEGARERLKSGRRRLISWVRRVAPAPVLLRVTVVLALFIAAELAVPPGWATAGLYIGTAAVLALLAALWPAGPAPLVAMTAVVGFWLLTSTMYEDHGPSVWTAAALACLLYAAHSAAAIAQRFRTTTAMDGEIILTWVRHLGLVVAATLVVAGILALFTAYFAGLPSGLAIAAGIVAAVTVIYVLARSLHKNP